MKIKPNEIAFDIDGVFADTIGAFIKKAKQKYGITIKYEDIKEYDLKKTLNIDERILTELAKEILYNPIKMGIKPIKGAVEVLKKLSERSKLLFVTARPDKEGIKRWVYETLKEIERENINIVAVGTHEEKIPFLRSCGIRYFVEDRLETCFLLSQASIIPIVFEQPWNRKPHPFLKVKNWKQIEMMIDW